MNRSLLSVISSSSVSQQPPEWGGEFWGPMQQGLGSSPRQFFVLDHDGSGLWAAAGDFAYVGTTTDGGENWTEALPPGQNSGTTLTRACQAVGYVGNNTWILVYEQGHASRSTDGLATFSMLPQGLSSPIAQMFSIGTDRQGTAVVGMAGGYASLTTDYGANWLALPQYLNSGASSTSARIVAVAGSSTGTYIAVMEGGGGFASRSVGGSIWAASQPDGPTSTLSFSGVATDNAGRWMVAASTGEFFFSGDDGVSWAAITTGAPSALQKVESGGLGSGVWVATGPSGLAMRTENNGSSWQLLPEGLNSGGGVAASLRLRSDRNGLWMAAGSSGWAAVSPELP